MHCLHSGDLSLRPTVTTREGDCADCRRLCIRWRHYPLCFSASGPSIATSRPRSVCKVELRRQTECAERRSNGSDGLNSRTPKLKALAKYEINSIHTNIGTKTKGVPFGTKNEKNLMLCNQNAKIVTPKNTVKLKPIEVIADVVTVKV